MTTNGNERESIVNRLREYFQSSEAKRFDLQMFEDEIEHSGTWWHVPVATRMPNINAFDYAPVLNRIEEEFDKEGTNVLLIPAFKD